MIPVEERAGARERARRWFIAAPVFVRGHRFRVVASGTLAEVEELWDALVASETASDAEPPWIEAWAVLKAGDRWSFNVRAAADATVEFARRNRDVWREFVSDLRSVGYEGWLVK